MRRICLVLASLLPMIAILQLPLALRAEDDADTLARMLLNGSGDDRRLALARIEAENRTDLLAPMIAMMRFLGPFAIELGVVMDKVAGVRNGPDWYAWMLWQETHPEIATFAGFDGFTADLHAMIDEEFRRFLYPGVGHRIRLEEIAWGGVKKDGIPSLDDPAMLIAAEADYLQDDDLVFGISIHDDARAYPLRILNWHEMANDVIGGVPVALAYCTLCGSAILYQTGTNRADRRLFGSSGFLYRSNKLMFDRATFSLWNQFTGRPVVGELADDDIALPILPVVIAHWADWRSRHPDSRVLSLDTGYARDYGSGVAYADYFASPDLMFPNAAADNGPLAAKDYVFVLRVGGESKTWPLARFADEPVINDRLGDRDVVLIGQAETRTVRAFASPGARFRRVDSNTLMADGMTYRIHEDALLGEAGTSLARLPGHVAYWFAAAGFLPDDDPAQDESAFR